MKRLYRAEIWKALHNPWCYLSLLVGTVLCLLDVGQNWQAIHDCPSNWETGAGAFSLFVRWIAVNNWTYGCRKFYLVWPILAALPFGWSFCQERRSGLMDQIYIRAGKTNTFFAKYLAVFVSGGLAIALPVLLNLLLNAMVCPYVVPKATLGVLWVSDGYFLSTLYYTHPWVYGFIWCGMEFLWGGVTAGLCFLVSSRTRLLVTVVLVPFALYFLMGYVQTYVARLTGSFLLISPMYLAMAATFNPNPEWLEFLALGILFLLSFGAGYWQVKKHELA